MIGNSLLIQVGIIGLSIAIVLTYIKPTFEETQSRQVDIKTTKDELAKVSEVNTKLANLVGRVNEIPLKNKQDLTVYLPTTLDEVRVLKDLSIISQTAQVILSDLSYDGSSESVEVGVPLLQHTFTITFESSYQQLKEFLSLMEGNSYPLDILSLSVSPQEGGFLSSKLKVVTYSTN